MKLRYILTLVALLLLSILIAGWITIKLMPRVERHFVKPKENTTDLGSVVTQVRALSRLETASMHVVNVSTIRQSYDFVPNAIGGDELTLFAAGDVIAGVDLSQVKDSDVWHEPDGTLVMRLPPPQLLVSRIDNRETRVIDRRTGLLRRADNGLEGRARQYAEQQVRREAVHEGILTTASSNAETKLAPLLHQLGFRKVRFEGGPAALPLRSPA